jgi:hypothetical protein
MTIYEDFLSPYPALDTTLLYYQKDAHERLTRPLEWMTKISDCWWEEVPDFLKKTPGFHYFSSQIDLLKRTSPIDSVPTFSIEPFKDCRGEKTNALIMLFRDKDRHRLYLK